MLLAVDIGNTNTVAGLYKEKNLVHQWRLRTDRHITADELAARIHGLFAMQQLTLASVNAAIIASVVPPLTATWSAFCKKYPAVTPLLVNDNLNTGIPIRTANPAEVGADRIVNSVAAYERYKKALIVVDFGTAITFDCVSQKGEYLGGAIAPGIAISLDALGKRTAKLPRVDISQPPGNAIGIDTVTAMRSGILFGYGGLVEGLLQRIKQEFAPDTPKVLATGGMAELITPYTPSIEELDPMLTLEGLRLLHERNK